MKLTTPYAVLAGFALVALAIASQPLTGLLGPEAWAKNDRPVKAGYQLGLSARALTLKGVSQFEAQRTS